MCGWRTGGSQGAGDGGKRGPGWDQEGAGTRMIEPADGPQEGVLGDTQPVPAVKGEWVLHQMIKVCQSPVISHAWSQSNWTEQTG